MWLGSVCPHFVGPQMVVVEPGAGRGDVQGENLLLRGVNSRVLNGQFGLWDGGCSEDAAAGREVLALAALSPRR